MWPFRKKQSPPPQIDLNSLCPACGHSGCTLKCIPAGIVEVGEKKKAIETEPMIERTCTTCGAVCYEKPVLEWSKWVKK